MAVFFPWWCTDVVYIDRRCKSLWRSFEGSEAIWILMKLQWWKQPQDLYAKWFKCAGECFLQDEFGRLVGINRFAALLISLCFWKLTAGKRKLCFALLLDVLQSILAFSSMPKKNNYIKKVRNADMWMTMNLYENA